MTLDTLRTLLGWSAIFQLAFLSLWFFAFVGFHDTMYRLHHRWLRLSVETFDAIHYAGMAWFKMSTWLFFILPWLVLRLFL